MGRLFWKFLVASWLATLLVTAGVGTAMWLAHAEREPRGAALPGVASPPPTQRAGPSQAGPAPAVDAPPPPMRPHRWHHRPPPMMPLVLGALGGLLCAAFLAWYFAKPLRSLRRAVAAVAGGDLAARVGDSIGGRRDELADLGRDFDHMAGRLQDLVDSQRRLLHDVSHELRSPLARLRASVDLMRQQPERTAEFIDRVDRESVRMDRLLGELLTLARVDAGTAGALDGEVDLTEVVAGIAEDAEVEAEARGCTLATQLPGSLVVRGSAELLHRAIENVVRNAIRHSPPGGAVSVNVSAGGQPLQACVIVDDAGPGVAEADLARIFEPFVRLAGTAGEGHGLGLAIAERVLRAHGGRIRAENRSPGLRVVLGGLTPAAAPRR